MVTDSTTLTLQNSDLAKLDAKQLFHLMDAFCLLDGLMSGMVSQPRLTEEGNRLNPAGQIIAELSDWLVYAKRAISDEVERRSEPTKADADWLGWARIQFEASYHDDMAAFNVVVAQALSAKESAHG